jgi:DNA-binding LacI/PurR family transcriptional regulator
VAIRRGARRCNANVFSVYHPRLRCQGSAFAAILHRIAAWGLLLNIHELAKHLGVSIGTVSRALNGRKGVGDEMRQQIVDAAKQHGYVPNQHGRSLRSGTTGMVGFMINANRDRAVRGETFFMTIFDGLQSVLSKRELDLVVYYCVNDQDPNAYVQRIVERRLVDGLIISQITRHDKRVDYLIESGFPFIAFGRNESGSEHSWVDLDFEGVARRSINLLFDKGHRRIAIGTSSDDANFGHIYVDACRAALAARGLPLADELILREPMSESGGYRLAERALGLEDRPTAIMVIENSMVIGVYTKLTEAGFAPGRDIAVVGFDQSPTSGLYLRPSLTQFRVSLADIGRWLGLQLMEQIDALREGTDYIPRHQIWPMEMLVGESTAMTVNTTENQR